MTEPSPQFYKLISTAGSRWGAGASQQANFGVVESGGDSLQGVLNPKAAQISMNRTLDYHEPKDEVDFHADTRPGQKAMFTSEEAGPWKVNWAFSHKDMTHHVPALLGMIGRHIQTTTPNQPAEASSDLSVHSKRMVDKFVEKGLIESPFEDERDWYSNGYELNSASAETALSTARQHVTEGAVPVSAQDARHASAFTRNILRTKKPRQPEVEAFQQHLFNDRETHVEDLPKRGPDGGPRPLVNARTAAGRAQQLVHTDAVYARESQRAAAANARRDAMAAEREHIMKLLEPVHTEHAPEVRSNQFADHDGLADWERELLASGPIRGSLGEGQPAGRSGPVVRSVRAARRSSSVNLDEL